MAGQTNGIETVTVNSYFSRVAFGVYRRRCQWFFLISEGNNVLLAQERR